MSLEDTRIKFQGFRLARVPIAASLNSTENLHGCCIAPLCVPSKNLLPVATESRSKSINFLHELHRKAHNSANLLEPKLIKWTNLLDYNKRLSPRTERILEGLQDFDFIDSDPLKFIYLEDYFSNLERLILWLEMFSDAEMNDKTGRKVDRVTLDAALMIRDAEKARYQIQSMTKVKGQGQAQLMIRGTVDIRPLDNLEYIGKKPLSQEANSDPAPGKLYCVDDNLCIEILNLLEPAKSTFVSSYIKDGGLGQSPAEPKAKSNLGGLWGGRWGGRLQFMKRAT